MTTSKSTEERLASLAARLLVIAEVHPELMTGVEAEKVRTRNVTRALVRRVSAARGALAAPQGFATTIYDEDVKLLVELAR